MATIQWRPEANTLTTPQSYRILAVPRNAIGTEDLAADIVRKHPNFNKADILTILNAENDAVKTRLLNGEQVTKSGAFSYSLTFSGQRDTPNAQLPPLDKSLHVNVLVSPPFVETTRQASRTERLPMHKKTPLIATARDTVLGLHDVLNPRGQLQLTGNNLSFDPKQGTGECVIAGTESGSTVQTHFGKIEDSEIMIMPNIPTQSNPWNNEYTVSVSIHYSEHDTPRIGTYCRMLRTPLTLSNFGHLTPPETGILTSNATSPYVSAIGGSSGSVTADKMLRIQAVIDLRQDVLLFSLIDMREEGRTGAVVTVTANGEFTLPGFANSTVGSMAIRVNNYAALKDMVRKKYSGRVVDVLNVTM